MASFVGAIEQFNPYIQQIPTEAYTKVGMFKEQQYVAGLNKVQENIDKIAGLDVANEGGRQYLRARVDELTKTLNKYSMVDFANPNNVSQLVGLAKPLYQDENIVNDVINTGIYRKWAATAQKKMESGDMDAVQYHTEQEEVSKWLNSKVAGSNYTGRSTPNDSTYEKINKKVLDFKSKMKPDTRYVEGSTYLYGNKSYNVSQLSELFYNNVLDANDREMLANNTIFDDSLRYNIDPNNPKNDLLEIYNGKKIDNENNLKKIDLQLQAFKDTDDPDYQSLVRDKEILESNIKIYDKTIKAFSQADPTNESQKRGIYTNISAEQYKNSLAAIFESEQLKPEYREDTKQSRDHKNATVNAAIAKGTVAYTQLKDENGQPMFDENGTPVMGIRAVLDENNDPAILEKQSDLIQTVDANGNIVTTLRPGGSRSTKKTNPLANLLQGTPGEVANFNVAGEGDIINLNREILSTEYKNLDGIIQQSVLAMTNTMARASTAGFNPSDYYTIEQVPGPDGKDVAAMVWKSPEKKKEFMSYVDMMNSAFEIEAADGNQANKSFVRYMNGELDAASEELGLQGVDPAILKDLMTLKGKNAILSMMDEVFKDKSVVKNLTSIDEAISQKKNISDSWRKVLTANAKNTAEQQAMGRLTDDEIMSLQVPGQESVADFFGVSEGLANKIADEQVNIKYSPNGDGTYTATAYIGTSPTGKALATKVLSTAVPENIAKKHGTTYDPQSKYDNTEIAYYDLTNPGDLYSPWPNKTVSDLTSDESVFKAMTGSEINLHGIDKETVTRANNQLKNNYSVIRQNITRSVSLLNLPENKQDKDALIGAVTNSLISQGGSKILSDPTFIQANQDDIVSITKVTDITGASNKSVGNIFNNSGFLNIQFKYQDKEGKEKEGTASYNIDRILTTDPAFASKFSKYFAGLKYAKEGAAIRIKAYIDPTSGYKTYSGEGSGNTISPLGNVFSDQKGYIGKEFTRHVIPTADGHQVPINYKVVSYGDSEELGNKLNNTNIDANKYAIQLQVNTPSGKQNIYLKGLNGDIIQYNTPEEALYQLKDELFRNVPVDAAADYVKKADGTKIANYFAEFNQMRPSIRGFFNTQLKLNGINVPNIEDIKKAYADLAAGRATELDKELLKFSPVY